MEYGFDIVALLLHGFVDWALLGKESTASDSAVAALLPGLPTVSKALTWGAPGGAKLLVYLATMGEMALGGPLL